MEGLPEEVKAFLAANIETVEQLEILRLLWEDPSREWGPAELAREVQAAPQAVIHHLAALQGRGLLTTTTQEGGVSARYGTANPELEKQVSLLLQLYRERPVTMIRLVYARASDVLKSFADAFRLRKED